MATYYVQTDGNDTTGDGSSGAPWATPGKAAAEMVDTDICYVKSGTYTLTTATPGAAGPVHFALSQSYNMKMEGYATTPGDRCIGGTVPLISAGTISPATLTDVVSLGGVYNKVNMFAYFKVDCNNRANVGGINGMSVDYSVVIGCEVLNCDAGYGFNNLRAIQCYAHDCGVYGFNIVWCVGSVSLNNTGYGFADCRNSMTSCISKGNSLYGYQGYRNSFINCVAMANGLNGFRCLRNNSMINCISLNHDNGYEYETYEHTMLINCAARATGSGRTRTGLNAPLIDYAPITLTGDPFEDSAALDFRLTSTGNGALCRAAGINPWAQDGALDLGAVQHADPEGGTTERIYIGAVNIIG